MPTFAALVSPCPCVVPSPPRSRGGRGGSCIVGRRPHGGLGHSCQGKAQGARKTMHRPAKSGPLGRPPRPIEFNARPVANGRHAVHRPAADTGRLRGQAGRVPLAAAAERREVGKALATPALDAGAAPDAVGP